MRQDATGCGLSRLKVGNGVEFQHRRHNFVKVQAIFQNGVFKP